MTFFKFLKLFEKERNSTGTLARVFTCDKSKPKINSYDAILKHLKKYNASTDICMYLKIAWRVYEHYNENNGWDFEKDIILYKYRDFWRIEVNVIPNFWYMESQPKLILVNHPLGGKCNNYDIIPKTELISITSKKLCHYISKYSLYFKREFQYDFISFYNNKQIQFGNRNINPFIILGENRHFHDETKILQVGACEFNYHSDEEWVLEWVWIHPFLRRQKYLSNVWGIFNKLYGDFKIREPLSYAMEKFIENINNSRSK